MIGLREDGKAAETESVRDFGWGGWKGAEASADQQGPGGLPPDRSALWTQDALGSGETDAQVTLGPGHAAASAGKKRSWLDWQDPAWTPAF